MYVTMMSCYQNVLLPKRPITEMSGYRNVLLPKCQLPKRPLPKCPLPKCLDTTLHRSTDSEIRVCRHHDNNVGVVAASIYAIGMQVQIRKMFPMWQDRTC